MKNLFEQVQANPKALNTLEIEFQSFVNTFFQYEKTM